MTMRQKKTKEQPQKEKIQKTINIILNPVVSKSPKVWNCQSRNKLIKKFEHYSLDSLEISETKDCRKIAAIDACGLPWIETTKEMRLTDRPPAF